MTECRLAPAYLLMAVALFMSDPLAARATELPSGFGALVLGMPWSEAKQTGEFTELGRPVTAWERDARDCGHHSARFRVHDGRVLVTVEDHVVTALSHTTAIEPGSDLMGIAARVMRNHGQPRQTTLRDELGAVTMDRARANHVVLEYRDAVDVAFAISGAPLWEYRTTVNDPDARRLENRTTRCAREREQGRIASEKEKRS